MSFKIMLNVQTVWSDGHVEMDKLVMSTFLQPYFVKINMKCDHGHTRYIQSRSLPESAYR